MIPVVNSLEYVTVTKRKGYRHAGLQRLLGRSAHRPLRGTGHPSSRDASDDPQDAASTKHLIEFGTIGAKGVGDSFSWSHPAIGAWGDFTGERIPRVPGFKRR
jgi:hypothetical protein